MPTPIVDVAGSAQNGAVAPDTSSVVTIHTGGVRQTSDTPAPVNGMATGADVTDSSIQIPQTIVSQAAAPQVLLKATGNPTVATHKTAFA
jgi:hypothetical protein